MEDIVSIAVADTSVLCSHLEPAIRLSHDILYKLFSPQDIIHILPDTNVPSDHALKDRSVDPRFHRLTAMAIGCKVMVTANTQQHNGVVNGATGTVHSVQYNHAGSVVAIYRMSRWTVMVQCVASVNR